VGNDGASEDVDEELVHAGTHAGASAGGHNDGGGHVLENTPGAA